MKSIFDYFNEKIRQAILGFKEKEIYEIRLRVNEPIVLNTSFGEQVIMTCIVCDQDIKDSFNRVTEYSAYAYEKNLAEGYITVPGGHRIGVGGYMTLQSDKSAIVKNIRFLNFRVRHFIDGCSNPIMEKLGHKNLENIFIISPPAMGKTTLLRDMIKNISNQNRGTSICVIDERNEIGGCHRGVPTIDLGMRTDVISNCPKGEGILMAIRAMAPTMIAVDEIGGEEDKKALEYASISGVKIMATLHGKDTQDAREKLGDRMFSMFGIKIIIKGIGEYICC